MRLKTTLFYILYRIVNKFLFLLLIAVVAIFLYDNISSSYTLYYRLLNLGFALCFLVFGGIVLGIQVEIKKLYRNPENRLSLQRITGLIAILTMVVSACLLGLNLGLLERLNDGVSLLG